MKDFFTKHNRLIVIISCALLAAVLAIVLALAIADNAQEIFLTDDYISYNSADATVSSNSIPQEVVTPLVITSPSKQDSSVSESYFAITGTSDPNIPLVLNGNAVERLENGTFTIEVELAVGKNTFVFEYNNETVTYIIRYNFTVIKAYAPYEKQSYEAGSSFVVVAFARVNSSSVTATFNGQTINLTRQPYEEGEEFANFTGTFTLPTGNETNLNLGGVKFVGVCNNATNRYTSPSITCLRDKSLDGTQVVEIVTNQAETFNGDTTDDWSRPTNSYLPKGTVDYKVSGIVYDAKSGNSYYNLRCGKRVYINKKNSPDTERVTVSNSYRGELPEYNTISLSRNEISSKHTVLTFDTAWRAPFAVEVGPQSYANPSKQEYAVSSVTFSYVDIKFFYTLSLGGEYLFNDNPIFSSAQILPGNDGCVLRLHLKSVGEFHGWNAEYNSNGQLVFKFLNPPKIREKNNLKGIKILIDAGHGGKDIGAPGLMPNTNHEAERNLALAYKLKAQLESYGATVVMTRTSNTTLSSDARCDILRRESPDLCISVHHDSSTRASASGGGSYCFNAFSDKVTSCVFRRMLAGGFYSKTQKDWHYFFLARVTSCPVVLTENGFISNQNDFNGIISENVNLSKAKSITQGVLDYFNSFYKNVANDDDNSYNDDNIDNKEPPQQDPVTPPMDEPNSPPDETPDLPPVVEPELPDEEDPTLPPEENPDLPPEQEENSDIGDENEKQ